MKIISNFKDYYCYLQGVYGVDPKVVYERVCQTKKNNKWVKVGVYKPMHLEFPKEYRFYMLAICGTIYCVFYYNNKFYIPAKAIMDIARKEKWWCDRKILTQELVRVFGKMNFDPQPSISTAFHFHLEKTKINDVENCPVILLENPYRFEEVAKIKNPKLSDFGIKTFIPAEAMYILLTNFLSKEKVIVDKRTDVEKLISKGFDKKTSFRKM